MNRADPGQTEFMTTSASNDSTTSNDATESALDQFGLGPEDEAHDDEGKPRKTTAGEADDSSVNKYGMGPEDNERS